MYNAAPKNGTVIAMIAPGTITVPLVRKVKYDAREFEWLGSPAARPYGLWAWHTTGIKTLEDTRKKEVTVATSGFAAAGSVLVRLMNATLGTKLKNIYGYRGGGQLNLAVERGEAQSRTNFYSGFMAAQPNWIKEKKVIPLIGMGPRDKHKEFIGVPHMRDLLKPGSLNLKVYDVLALNLKVGQGFYIPQGSSKQVRNILGDAFDKMVADPDFERQILKRRIEFSPVPAAKIRKIIKDGFAAATPEVVKALKAIFKKTK
jgi:tripartite-type tricarboxylate transporter receptor subunit TctC